MSIVFVVRYQLIPVDMGLGRVPGAVMPCSDDDPSDRPRQGLELPCRAWEGLDGPQQGLGRPRQSLAGPGGQDKVGAGRWKRTRAQSQSGQVEEALAALRV